VNARALERLRLRAAEAVAADFKRGMWNGKLSALRWALGEDRDFLDT
jgi:hypothetical protein